MTFVIYKSHGLYGMMSKADYETQQNLETVDWFEAESWDDAQIYFSAWREPRVLPRQKRNKKMDGMPPS